MLNAIFRPSLIGRRLSVVNNDFYSANEAAVTSASLITATSTSSRQLQFALKIAW
jgi:hypothetical protein